MSTRRGRLRSAVSEGVHRAQPLDGGGLGIVPRVIVSELEDQALAPQVQQVPATQDRHPRAEAIIFSHRQVLHDRPQTDTDDAELLSVN